MQASNWCQTTQTFLEKMREKVDHCTSISEAKDLLEELSVYMSVTKDQQSARVEQVCEPVCVYRVGGVGEQAWTGIV